MNIHSYIWMKFFTQIAKYINEIFQTQTTQSYPFYAPVYSHWWDRMGVKTILCSCLLLVCLHFFYLLVIIKSISFHYCQNVSADRYKTTCTKRKLPCSQPKPFPGSWTICLGQKLSRIHLMTWFLWGCIVWSWDPWAPCSCLDQVLDPFQCTSVTQFWNVCKG